MKYLSFGSSAAALGIVLAACSADSSGTVSGAGASSGSASNGTTSTGSAASGAGGGIGLGCQPVCTPPQICSTANVCIDPGTCAADADCPEGTACDTTTGACGPGGGCGAQEATAEAVPPNMLIVLDRSCSMNNAPGGSPSTKWEIAVAAIEKMTTDFNGKIRFGLTMFPDRVTPNCDQDAIPVPCGPGNEATIQSMLTASLVNTDPNFPNGPCVTNIDTAMLQAATEPAFNDTTRSSYALLLTDGRQSFTCAAGGGDAGTTQAITDLYQNRNVPTFVLGFGIGGIDPAQMNIFADAGGVPSSDPVNHFYLAEDQMSLDAALSAIASKTLGCSFSLNSVPPDPSKIFVFFDNNTTPIPQDPTHTDGWDYDPATNQITFYGTACDSLKNGAIADVDIVFGCAQPTPD